jgi:hypothetical protein
MAAAEPTVAQWDASTYKDLREVVLAANADGIDLLRRGQEATAFEQLKFAEAVLVANPDTSIAEGALLALTCSNLGCYYRQKGLPRAALKYFERAQNIESESSFDSFDNVAALAKTKLNACAALSSLGQHHEAERLAMEAVDLLIVRRSDDVSPKDASLFAVACHNLGAERQHLGRFGEAGVAYRQGAEVARKSLGPGSPLARQLAESSAHAFAKAARHPSHAPAQWKPESAVAAAWAKPAHPSPRTPRKTTRMLAPLARPGTTGSMHLSSPGVSKTRNALRGTMSPRSPDKAMLFYDDDRAVSNGDRAHSLADVGSGSPRRMTLRRKHTFSQEQKQGSITNAFPNMYESGGSNEDEVEPVALPRSAPRLSSVQKSF